MKKPLLAVVDYGMGNLGSVSKALEKAGARVEISESRAAFGRADGIVLPGVGAFKEAMRRLKALKLTDPLRKWIGRGRAFMGICLGFQLIFDESEEFGLSRGLGCFPGRVVAFPKGQRVPHMGWNQLVPTPGSVLLGGLPARPFVYFVHTYFPVPKNPGIVAARTRYGVRFASAIEKGNVAGVQFHPEKSQKIGLSILRNFIRMAKRSR